MQIELVFLGRSWAATICDEQADGAPRYVSAYGASPGAALRSMAAMFDEMPIVNEDAIAHTNR